jgi:hypothetical protein
MARKVYVTVQVETIILLDDEVNLDLAMDEMECTLSTENYGAEVIDAVISDYKVTDSK